MMNRTALNPTFAPSVPRTGRPLYLLGAALLLLVLQVLSGTGAVFALLVFVLLVLSYCAVIWAGGLESLFGLAILYLLLQHVLVSQIAKVFFWESADAPLLRPLETIGIYDVGMASFALGILLANRFRRRKGPLFVAETEPSRLFWMSVLCTIVFTAVQLVGRTIGTDAQTGGAIQGGVLGPLKQLSFLGPLAVASGTACIIRSSGGRHSIGLVNAVPMIIQISFAILSAFREATITPIIVYGLTCIAFRYRFRLKHYSVLFVGAYVANFIIFPYALIARGLVRTGSFEENVSRSSSMMMEIVQNPFKYRDQVDHLNAKRSSGTRRFDYFNNPSPTLTRYSLIVVSDGLVDAAIIQGFTGWETITPGFEAALPRFLNPDKPFVQIGNFLTHRVPGLRLDKKDHTTGISIGLFSENFTSFGWQAVAIIPCLVIFCLMTIYRFLIDDRIWGNVLMLSLVPSISFLALSENSTADMIVMCSVGPLALSVGLAGLYTLVHILDKTTGRLRGAVAANTHPRQQALQRVLTAAPQTGKSIGIKRPVRSKMSDV